MPSQSMHTAPDSQPSEAVRSAGRRHTPTVNARMFGATIKLAIRSLLARPLRTILTGLGVVLGVAVILAIIVTNASTARNFPNTSRTCETGRVSSTSRVPDRCSSLHWRMVKAASRKINSSGIQAVGVTDVADSLAAIDELVFRQRRYSLAQVLDASRSVNVITIVGLPLQVRSMLFNCAVVVYQGRILGAVPKTYLPNYREYYEKRWFAPAASRSEDVVVLNGASVDFAPGLFQQAGALGLGGRADAGLLGGHFLGAGLAQGLELAGQRRHLPLDRGHLRRGRHAHVGGLPEIAANLRAAIAEVLGKRRPQKVDQRAGENEEVEQPRGHLEQAAGMFAFRGALREHRGQHHAHVHALHPARIPC